MKKGNLFELKNISDNKSEIFQTLAKGTSLIERIVSVGQITPENEWYDQEHDEWVALLQGDATILFDKGNEVKLVSGDFLLIKAHQKHRVTSTSVTPPCIWLAIHGNFSDQF